MLISVLFIGSLTAQSFRAEELRRSGAKTVGKIERIERIKISLRKTRRVFHVGYTVEGKKYSNTTSYVTPWMRLGDKLDVYYDPQNPSASSVGEGSEYLTLGIGIMLLGLSLGFLAFWTGVRGLRKR
jgi:hypothetical protein